MFYLFTKRTWQRKILSRQSMEMTEVPGDEAAMAVKTKSYRKQERR